MAILRVIITGYVREGDEADSVQPTICLIKAGDMTLLTDPGILANPSDLVEGLAREQITPESVTDIFVTHHHIDHTRNVGMFPRARVYDGASEYSGDRWGDHDGEGFEIARGVSILQTPGHSASCASLLVETDEGRQVVTHAWWFEGMDDDPMADDAADLDRSRKRILDVADIVIPGHGAAFRVGN